MIEKKTIRIKPFHRHSPVSNCTSTTDDDSIAALQQPARRYPQRIRKPAVDLLNFHNESKKSGPKEKPIPEEDDELDKIDALYSWYKWSDCKLAERYDRERNFFPEPGPSNLNYYEDVNLKGYYRSVSSASKRRRGKGDSTSEQQSTDRKTKQRKLDNDDAKAESPITKNAQAQSDTSDWEDDIHIQSFYEKSFAVDPLESKDSSVDHVSPISMSSFDSEPISKRHNESIGNTIIATPLMSKFLESLKNSSSEEKNRRPRIDTVPHESDHCKITPLEMSVNRTEIKQMLNSNQLPKVIHPIPYYSNPNDLLADRSKKEIGHTVLLLTGNGVSDCDEFQSESNVTGLSKWQRLIGEQTLRRSARDTKNVDTTDSIRKRLAREEKVRIQPNEFPPKRALAKRWLKMREQVNAENKELVKVQQDKPNGYGKAATESSAKVQRKIKQSKQNNALQNGEIIDLSNGFLSSEECDTVESMKEKKEVKVNHSQWNYSNHVQFIENDNAEDDDVICLDDSLPTNHININYKSQLVGSTR